MFKSEVYEGEFYTVLTNEGNWIVPIDVSGVVKTQKQRGWLYRLSASDYMDATSWGVASSELEALQGLLEMYGPDRTDDNGERLDWEKEAEERIKDIQAGDDQEELGRLSEQQRQDEKQGLYGQHIDPTN